MKVVQVQNHPRHGGGASNLFNMSADLLETNGSRVIKLERRSSDLGTCLRGKLTAFTSGIYSLSARLAIRRIIESQRPDIVHVHDLYPLLAGILPECRKAGVPVVMTCHNYRLTCPSLLHFHDGTVCEKCCGGREYWCIRNNCRGDLFESAAFAIQNLFARKSGLFTKNVTLFIALTEFVRDRLQGAGVSPEKIMLLPNRVNIGDSPGQASRGHHVSYVGRFSAEKGIEVLLVAAENNPAIPVKLAGDHCSMPGVTRLAPKNTEFVGHLNKIQLHDFYWNSRFVVVPSRWFEVHPLVVLEAMGHGLPVIAARIGSLKEIIEEGVTGLLFEPCDPEDLSRKIKMLWENNDLCDRMGRNARQKAINDGNQEAYYKRLISIYEKAVKAKHI